MLLMIFLNILNQSIGGLLPIALHTDGAEFYSNSEYLVWSFSSVLAEGHPWDTRFPICILPHDSLQNDDIKREVHRTIAKVVGWSLRYASTGVAPLNGFYDEPLSGYRGQLAGKPLAHGWKACYFCFRYDEKARKETNYFCRTYQHSLICMYCPAQRPHKDWIPALSYKDMSPNAPHTMSPISGPLSCLVPFP